MTSIRAIIETSTEIEEPWLLDSEDLLALDEELQLIWERFEKDRRAAIEQLKEQKRKETEPDRLRNGGGWVEKEIDFAVPWKLKESRRSVALRLQGSLRIEAESFEALLRRRELLEQSITDISIRFESRKRVLEISQRSDEIQVKASPDDDDLVNELFSRLLFWRERVRPKRWVRWWKSYGFIGAVLGWIPLTLLLATFMPTTDQARLESQAEAVLEGGVDAEEYDGALELLLRKEFQWKEEQGGAQPQPSRAAVRLRVFLATIVLVCLVMSIPPRSTIGVGKNEAMLRWRRAYIRLVSVVVPVTIFMSLVAEPFLSWMRSLVF